MNCERQGFKISDRCMGRRKIGRRPCHNTIKTSCNLQWLPTLLSIKSDMLSRWGVLARSFIPSSLSLPLCHKKDYWCLRTHFRNHRKWKKFTHNKTIMDVQVTKQKGLSKLSQRTCRFGVHFYRQYETVVSRLSCLLNSQVKLSKMWKASSSLTLPLNGALVYYVPLRYYYEPFSGK